jgi:hypothetical protein
VAREFSLMAKAVVMVLETLPDVLERDCALTPAAVSRVQSVIDDLRDQMAEKVLDAEKRRKSQRRTDGKAGIRQGIRRDVSGILRAPRRMPVADAVRLYARANGGGNSVPWDPDLAPYVIEPMNCLASREYDAVVFVGPARTGKTIGLIDGWIVYNIVCDPAICSLFRYPKKRRASIQKTPGSYFPLQP